ncbi:MAG TPA: DUF1634 domain-containing protein [Chloroflexota bacterium]
MAHEIAPLDDDVLMADREASRRIAATLFGGLLVSMAVMVIGLILVAPEGKNAATTVLPLDRVLPDLVHGSRPAVLDAGILLLFATPLLGVLVALTEFARQRDRTFTAISCALVLVLAAGFAVALH